MFSPVVMRAPLGIIIDLIFMECHSGNGAVLKQGLGQTEHAGTNHQCIGSLSGLGIVNGRTESKRLSTHSDINNQCVTNHPCLDVLTVNSGLFADAVMLDFGCYLTATLFPVFELGHLAFAIAPCQWVGQFAALG